ncbi:MAG: hypothetical protein ACI4P7_01675 [Bacilli bacterium]
MIISLEKAREFESLVKRVLISKYGKMLPSDKITLLNTTEFLDESIIKADPSNVYGEVIRKVVGSVIDITCTKELYISEDEAKDIIYGEYLEEGLIEFYSRKIAEKFNLNLEDKPELKDNLDMVQKLYEKLGEGLDEKVFSEDALEILDAAELEELITECDNQAIESYLNNLSTAKGIGEVKDEVTPINGKGDVLDEEGRVQIVYLNGVQYIKYVDKEDQVHLVETNDSKHVSEVYRKTILGLNPGDKLDAEAFFKELTSYIPETNLDVKEDIKTSSLNNEEVNMMNFIHSSKEFELDGKEDVITHSSDQTIHVIENTNDIVVTDDKGDHVESTVISDDEDPELKDDAGGVKPEEIQEEEKIDEKVLTPEEYEKLCMKFANNEELTLEELRALRRSTPEEMVRSQKDKELLEQMREEENELVRQNEGPILSYPGKYKYGSAAFTNKYLLIYVILITICIGFIVGALLFKTFGMK